jgi:hypothetical protein
MLLPTLIYKGPARSIPVTPKRFWGIKETTGCKKSFLHSEKLKLPNLCASQSINLRLPPSIRYHIRRFVKNKINWGTVDKAMYQDVRLLRELIFCISTQSKIRFGG